MFMFLYIAAEKEIFCRLCRKPLIYNITISAFFQGFLLKNK